MYTHWNSPGYHHSTRCPNQYTAVKRTKVFTLILSCNNSPMESKIWTERISSFVLSTKTTIELDTWSHTWSLWITTTTYARRTLINSTIISPMEHNERTNDLERTWFVCLMEMLYVSQIISSIKGSRFSSALSGKTKVFPNFFLKFSNCYTSRLKWYSIYMYITNAN